MEPFHINFVVIHFWMKRFRHNLGASICWKVCSKWANIVFSNDVAIVEDSKEWALFWQYALSVSVWGTSVLELVGSTARQSVTEHSLPFDSCSRVLFRNVICLFMSRMFYSLPDGLCYFLFVFCPCKFWTSVVLLFAVCGGIVVARVDTGDCVVYQSETATCPADGALWYLVQRRQQVLHFKWSGHKCDAQILTPLQNVRYTIHKQRVVENSAA